MFMVQNDLDHCIGMQKNATSQLGKPSWVMAFRIILGLKFSLINMNPIEVFLTKWTKLKGTIPFIIT